MNKRQLDFDIIKKWLASDDENVRYVAMLACRGRDVPLDIVIQGLDDNDFGVRAAAIEACQDKDIPLDIIKQGLEDDNWIVRNMAMLACQGRDISFDIIKQGLSDDTYNVRAAAMDICQDLGVPFDILKQWLTDDECNVRAAAVQYIKNNNINIDIESIYVPYRAIEPPKKVYKKCMGDVIVVATIPDDAEIRGGYCNKYRANKAKIIDIIGTFGGVKVGVSMYDKRTTYFVGDEVCVDNFDLFDNECSTGFHFFCDIEQAKYYGKYPF